MNWAKSKQWLNTQWPIGQAASMAILLEASAPKAGNVSPGNAFADMDFTDFLASAVGVAVVFEQAANLSVGRLVLDAVEATRERCGLNTNLGTLLLLAPLAKAGLRLRSNPSVATWATEVERVLGSLTPRDAELIYAAIRVAKPGGLGQAEKHDVQSSAPADLRAAMAQAAPVDAVARQYVNNFADVLEQMLIWLRRGLVRGAVISDLVGEIQLRWLAAELDGLIVRKAGIEIATEAQQLAVWALDEYLETNQRGTRWLALDTFLRGDGHNRNPGTTADLIAAALYAMLISPRPMDS